MIRRQVRDFRTNREAAERQAFPENIGSYVDRGVERFAERALWRSVEGDPAELTFRQFQIQTLKCAQGLRSLGVCRGSHVALMLPNVPAFLVAWVSLARIGAVAVPLNTAYTGRELGNALRESESHYLLIDEAYCDTYAEIPEQDRLSPGFVIVHGAPMAGFPNSWKLLLEVDLRAPDTFAVDADEVASMQFTSGSSGLPKACMLSHRYWMMIGRARACSGPAPSHVLIDTPMYYMGPMWRFMMTIQVGATLCVARRYSLSRLITRVRDYDVDFCLVTNPVAKLPDDSRFRDTNLLWLATYGLNKELHEGLEQRFGVPVRELYGMTEVGAALFMPLEDRHMVGSGSCGIPAPFRECRIVVDGHEAADGEEGELWIAGPGIFSGYYRRDAAAAAAFEGRWFRTGDLFRRDRDGYYYMLGRIKDVIRRSGENISATEIEHAVTAVPGILEAAAVPVPDEFRGEEVKIYVVLAPGTNRQGLPPADILDHCRNYVAPFKLPRYIEYVEDIPKTPTGKIDKNALKGSKPDLRIGCFDSTEETWR